MKKRLKISKLVKCIPNAITLCNSWCGFAAILYTLRVYDNNVDAYNPMSVFAVSAYIILFAMIFDALDGYFARILNASSLEGIEIDSLADMVTFGVAPATIVAIMTHVLMVTNNNCITRCQEILIYCLCSIYIGGAALRLAKYNIKALFPAKNKYSNPEYFSGLPSPGAASAICAIVLVAPQYDISLKYLGRFLPVYAALLGLLMVSNIPYMHAARWLLSIRRNRKRLIIFIFIMLFILVASFKGHTLTALAIIFTLYIFSGIFNLAVNASKNLIRRK